MNFVLIEKDINADVPLDEGGASEVLCMDRASKLSCQATYEVDTPVGATIKFQKSNDQVNWNDIQAATTITVSGTTLLEVANVDFKYFRTLKALTSGDVDLVCLTRVIGEPQ